MFSTNIEKKTLSNKHYRKVLYTDAKLQLVVMCIPPGGTIPMEIHKGSQFIRVETGSGSLKYGNSNSYKTLKDGIAVIIPPGVRHEVKSTGKTPLKLYAVYTPPEHKKGTIQLKQSSG